MINLSAVIEAVVYEKQGCKGVELFGEIVQYYHKNGFTIPDFDEVVAEIEKMVKNTHLTEIEYSVPQMRERVKSFYLPANTSIKIRGIAYDPS